MYRLGWRLLRSRSSTVTKNGEIIFEKVRVIDKAGTSLGEMTTSEGIKIAQSRGLDLFLINFESDPPVCQITDSPEILNESTLDEKKGFSFDPTLRPASIRFSSTIDELEFERKIDILQKHLLEKRRCEVVVYHKSSVREAEEIIEILSRILREVREVAKPAEELKVSANAREFTLKVWPCNPDQLEPASSEQIHIDHDVRSDDSETLEPKGHPRKFRSIRARIDPRLQVREKRSDKSSDNIE
jgi:translation initiation factor IF-3